jgi:hypothetical protein
MNQKFALLKSRYAALRKDGSDKPQPNEREQELLNEFKQRDAKTLRPQGNVPLSTTTTGPTSFEESGREITAAGAPTKWNAGASRAEQTSATKFDDKSIERRKKSAELAAKALNDRTSHVGDLANLPAKPPQHTAPLHVRDAVQSFTGNLERAAHPRFQDIATNHIMNALSSAHNYITGVDPMQSFGEQRAQAETHAQKAAAKMQQLGAENQETFTSNAHLFAPGTTSSTPITQRTTPTHGMTDEEIATQNPDLATVAAVGQSPEYQKFNAQWPMGGHNILSASKLNRLAPEGARFPGAWMNMGNSVRQLKNSNIIANLRQKPVDKMRSLTPRSDKTPTTQVNVSGRDLYFPEHAPRPEIDPIAFHSDAQKYGDQWHNKVNLAKQEKDKLVHALASVHSSLSDAALAHANGDPVKHADHLRDAKIAAQQVENLKHNSTQETSSALSMLHEIPSLIESSLNFPHSASKEAKYTHRDALHAIQDSAQNHLKNVQHIGEAFDEHHVKRTNPEQIAVGRNIPEETTQTPKAYQEEKPISIRERTENQRPQVRGSHAAHDPEAQQQIFDSHLQPSSKDNSLAREAKDFLQRNSTRAFTHGKPVSHPTSQEFLDSVPITTMHNYFDHNDTMKLGGVPARQFVQNMTQKIMNHGLVTLEPKDQVEFANLNRLYDQASNKLSQEDMNKLAGYHQQIKDAGLARMLANKTMSSDEVNDFRAAQFMAANRQQREDYDSENSAINLKNMADDIAQSGHPEALQDLVKLKQVIGASPKTILQYDPRTQSVSHNPTAVQGNSYARAKTKQHISNLIQQLNKKPLGKSMPTAHERLNKCRASLTKARETLAKIGPTGKHVRMPDGTLVLVDQASTPAQQDRKQVLEAQNKKPVLPPSSLPPVGKPAAPAPRPVAPAPAAPAPKPAVPAQAPKSPVPPPPQVKPQTPPPVKPQAQKQPPMMDEAIRQVKAQDAMSIFGYQPKK